MVRTLACLRHGVRIAGSNPGVPNFFANAFSFLKHLVYINDGLIPSSVCLRSYNNLTLLFIASEAERSEARSQSEDSLRESE